MKKFLVIATIAFVFAGCADKSAMGGGTTQNTVVSYKIHNPNFSKNHTEIRYYNGKKYSIPRSAIANVVNDANSLQLFTTYTTCSIGDVGWIEPNLADKLLKLYQFNEKNPNQKAETERALIQLLSHNTDKFDCVSPIQENMYSYQQDNSTDTTPQQQYVRQNRIPKVQRIPLPDNLDNYIDGLVGIGSKEQVEAARNYWNNALDNANDQMYNIAQIQNDNYEAKVREAEAIAQQINMLANQCNSGNANSCMVLGNYALNNNEIKFAKELYGKACDNRLQQGCDNFRILQEKGY